MIPRFFIDRPIFANVIAILTVLFGVVALGRLPVEQYPEITPPTVRVSTNYPGASAQVVADTVASPIEQQVNGVEHMLYMSSVSAGDGSYTLTITFDIGSDLDEAQVLVQNRVNAAEAQLPEEVRRQGIIVKKQTVNIIQVISLISPDKTFDGLYLSNYATLRIRDELSRIYGVGDVRTFGGADYGMRVWLDPDQLKSRNLTAVDVLRAIREQNVQVAAGQVGQPPVPGGQAFQLTVNTLGRLSDPKQFEQIVVKSEAGNKVTYLKDVGRVELGGQNYDQFAMRSGHITASLAIFQLPGANALEVADKVSAAMKRLSKDFPKGMEYAIPFDTTLFVRASIHEVYATLIEAGVLVLIVIIIFLQDWRAVLIPATTVPVTLVGTFAMMSAMGFTINILTLFGLVLAIGIVVDDAIVIVENAAHHMEQGMTPRDATIQAMSEVTAPIIGITLVLMAVFLPTSFLGGITGQLYQQFALTIAATAFISAINALTLKPAQSARWMKPAPAKRMFLYRWFNAFYRGIEWVYVGITRVLIRFAPATMVAFVLLVGATIYTYLRLPTGFLPVEDQGYLIAIAQLPDASSLERTREVVIKAQDIMLSTPGVKDVNGIGGFSFLDSSAASNAATFFIIFKPWEERKDPKESMLAVLGTLRQRFAAELPEAFMLVLPPPSIRGLGTTGGFQLQLQDRGGVGLGELQKMVQELQEDGKTQSALASVSSTFRSGVPQLYADIDRVKVKSLGLDLNDVFGTLQASMGSWYVNDFNKFGRTYQVRVQAESKFRTEPESIRKLEVRNNRGTMVPLGAVADLKRIVGPQVVPRYNLYPSALVTGESAPGHSSGDAMAVMEQMLAGKLPASMGYEWTGISYQEKQVGGESLVVFGLAVLMVFLVLAAQYESWVAPAAVILVVPLALLGAAVAIMIRGMENNIYTQIGIVLIIALGSKNAILIVEFARHLRREGRTIRDAALEAARLRFRPIVMTSLAFILGVWPLVYAEGAGSAGRRAIGTAVFGGMIASTVLAVFFVPVFFVIVQKFGEWCGERHDLLPGEVPLGGLKHEQHAEATNGHSHQAHPPAAETSAS
jgi:HAE1 family hydrophobic/amphiphilic exporter-1